MLEKLETTQCHDYTRDDLNLIHTGSTLVEDDLSIDTEKQFQDIQLDENDKQLVASIEDREAEEKKIRKTIDFRMMPLFCIFYFVDYLDRANIGNATLAGIQDDLHLTPRQLSTAISAFYITYILFEVPSNIILKKTSAVKWLSFIMLLWGIMTLVMAFAKNFSSLLICRLLLGAAESGYVPGILYIMSKVYKPSEFTFRVAILVCMASLSGIVSGPIAYGTSFLEGQRGLHGWQYLFILEGVPTIILSVVSYFYLFDDISAVTWLSDAQKALHRDYTNAPKEEAPITGKGILKATFDIKTILFSTTFFLSAVNHVSHQVFCPVIIDGFGFSVLTSQLLSAPPSILQTCSTVLGGYLTDKYNKRGYIMVIGFSIMSIGYTLLLVLHERWARYAALFVIPLGLGLQTSANVGWSAINFPKLEIRVIAVAVVVMIGNSGGVVSSYLYPTSDGPQFRFGNTFNLCCAVMGAISSGFTSYYLYKQNQKLDQLYGPVDKDSKNKEEQFRYYY